VVLGQRWKKKDQSSPNSKNRWAQSKVSAEPVLSTEGKDIEDMFRSFFFYSKEIKLKQ